MPKQKFGFLPLLLWLSSLIAALTIFLISRSAWIESFMAHLPAKAENALGLRLMAGCLAILSTLLFLRGRQMEPGRYLLWFFLLLMLAALSAALITTQIL